MERENTVIVLAKEHLAEYPDGDSGDLPFTEYFHRWLHGRCYSEVIFQEPKHYRSLHWVPVLLLCIRFDNTVFISTGTHFVNSTLPNPPYSEKPFVALPAAEKCCEYHECFCIAVGFTVFHKSYLSIGKCNIFSDLDHDSCFFDCY